MLKPSIGVEGRRFEELGRTSTVIYSPDVYIIGYDT